MDNKSVIHAMIACFLALGESIGEPVLQRAGDYIRRLLADDVMDPDAVEILETVLVGIDAEEPATITFQPGAHPTLAGFADWLEPSAA